MDNTKVSENLNSLAGSALDNGEFKFSVEDEKKLNQTEDLTN
jgi:hypothetical protein